MDETLKQLGGLLLGSIPTVIFMVLIYAAYAVLVHKPLSKILAERHERTEGAVAKAKADVAAAEARTAEYEQRLREARMAVFKAQEAKRQQAAQVRTAAVAEARKVAQARVEQERAGIARRTGERARGPSGSEPGAGYRDYADGVASGGRGVCVEPPHDSFRGRDARETAGGAPALPFAAAVFGDCAGSADFRASAAGRARRCARP